jgi:hypothetical protein
MRDENADLYLVIIRQVISALHNWTNFVIRAGQHFVHDTSMPFQARSTRATKQAESGSVFRSVM